MRPASKALVLTAAALGVLILARCSFGIDPDQGHFSCVTVADCASGQDCIPQADGGNGLCYPEGQCVPETCNGKDDDCDGVVDNHQPCGPSGACVDGGCIDCSACANAICGAYTCTVDGGTGFCNPEMQPDGGIGPGYVCVPP